MYIHIQSLCFLENFTVIFSEVFWNSEMTDHSAEILVVLSIKTIFLSSWVVWAFIKWAFK